MTEEQERQSFADELTAALNAAGFEVDTLASVLAQSPYRYVYVWLTEGTQEERIDARHFVISEGEEWGEPGILVGDYQDANESADVGSVPDIEAAVKWAISHRDNDPREEY